VVHAVDHFLPDSASTIVATQWRQYSRPISVIAKRPAERCTRRTSSRSSRISIRRLEPRARHAEFAGGSGEAILLHHLDKEPEVIEILHRRLSYS
jgi:hypothetical protein